MTREDIEAIRQELKGIKYIMGQILATDSTASSTAGNQVIANNLLTTIDASLNVIETNSASTSLPTGAATETTLNSALIKLNEINTTLQSNKDFEQDIFYDKTDVTKFYKVRDVFNVNTQTFTNSILNIDGSVPGVLPLFSNLVQVVSSIDYEFNTIERKAIVAGTGYSINDRIQELQIMNMSVGTLVNTIWVNKTTSLLIAAPTFAHLVIDDSYANIANQVLHNTKLDAIIIALNDIKNYTDGLETLIGASNTALTSVDNKLPSGLTVTANRLQVELPFGGGGLTNTELRATAVPVSLTSTTITGTVNTTALTDAQIRATPLPITGSVTANAGTNLNTSALGLEATQLLIKAKTDNIDVLLSTRLKPSDTLTKVSTVDTITNTVTIKADTLGNQTNALKIDGSLVTQPISASTLPLPTGASTSANQVTSNNSLSNIDTKIPSLGQALASASTPVVLTAAQIATLTPASPITGFNLESTQLFVKAKTDNLDVLLSTRLKPSDTLTAVTTVSAVTAIINALPAGNNNIGDVDIVSLPSDITNSGSITAISQNVALALNGQSSGTVQITGTWTGTLQFEGTLDNTNWIAINAVAASTSGPQPTTTVNGLYRLTPGGLTSFRVVSTSAITGTVVITIKASNGVGGTFVNQILPIKIDQTTPGTTNKVSIGTDGQVAINGSIFFFSTANSTVAQLASGATFTGAVESIVNQQTYSLLFFSDQNATVTLNQFIDASGTKNAQQLVFNYIAGSRFARSGALNGNFAQLVIQNTGGSTSTTLQGDLAYGNIPPATQLNNNPSAINEINGTVVSSGSGTSDLGTLRITQAIESASGNITTQNLVPNGVATANSAVEITLNGASALSIQTTGTYTGALSIQLTNDNSRWETITSTAIVNAITGAYSATITSAAIGIFQFECGGFLKARIAGLAVMTGTAVVSIRASRDSPLITIDNALPTGTNTIGAVNLASAQTLATVTTVGTVTALTTLNNGQTAHSSAVTGSPLRIGGKVKTTNDTTLVSGDASDIVTTTDGAIINKIFSAPELDWTFACAAPVANTTDVIIKSAAGAGLRNYLTGFQIINASATVATEVVIKDGVTVIWRGYVGIGTVLNSAVGTSFLTPLKGTAATALNFACITTASSVYVNAQGYVAP